MFYTTYLYLVGKYRDAREGIASVLQNYGWARASGLPGRLSELELSVNSETLDNGHNGNGHVRNGFSISPFYPTNDSSKRGHHNHYSGHNTTIARHLHASRIQVKKPVPIAKRDKHSLGRMRSQRPVPFSKYHRIFSRQN